MLQNEYKIGNKEYKISLFLRIFSIHSCDRRNTFIARMKYILRVFGI